MPRGSQKLPLLIAPGGVREDVNPADVPDGSLLASSNWLTRQGVGRPRPGYEQVGSTLTSANAVLGFGTRGNPGTTTPVVVHSQTAAYKWDGIGTFTDITGTWTASTIGQHVRMVPYLSGGTNWLLRVNQGNAIDKWDGVSAAFIDAGGTPPDGLDITVGNGRAVVIAPTGYPVRVQWNDLNDIDSWTATNYKDLFETPDNGVAVRAFGPLSIGVYKEETVWLAVAQAAKQPFQFQLVQQVPGPVSPAVLVGYRGRHYWLAHDGVVYAFDGSRVIPFATGVALTFRTYFDWANRSQAHAYIQALPEPELWIVYPVLGGTINRAFSVNLSTGAINTHLVAHNITASAEWIAQAELTWDDLTGTWDTLSATYATWDSMATEVHPTSILGTSLGKVFQFGIPTDDAGTAIPWSFTHGWRALAGLGMRAFIDGVVSYWTKLTASLSVTVGITVTDSLSDADTETTGTINLSTASEHLVNVTNKRGQWVKVRHAGTASAADIEHRGAAVMGWKRGMV